MVVAILLLVALLAFANGANDNCKGVATLVGFGTARPRQALVWAALTTAVGAVVSLWLAGGLIKSFSSGLFARGTPLDGWFFVAVLAGAFGWVILATVTGMPVSTTHAITGGLTGAGLVALSAGQIRWGDLGSRFALPLALGPVLSLVLVYLVSWPVRVVVRRLSGRCVCVVERPVVVQVAAGGVAVAAARRAIVADSVERCAAEAPVAAASARSAAAGIHWASSGMVGFARGWNDAPKIAALGIGTLTAANVEHPMAWAFAIVTVAMAAGGLVAGRRVLRTLAKKVTPLPLAESLTASLATAALVSAASWFALPVSTTHVATGGIVGAGLRNDPSAVRWGKVGEIVLSWLVTLPVAALLAATVKYLLS